MLAIVEGSRHPEKAMEFIALPESDSYLLNTIIFGLEGKHFNFVDETRTRIEQFAAFNASGTEAQSLGYNYNPTGMNTILTNVNEVKKQYNLLTCGIMEGDVEADLAAMNQAMEDAGLSQVLQDVQAQFDAWKAGN